MISSVKILLSGQIKQNVCTMEENRCLIYFYSFKRSL